MSDLDAVRRKLASFDAEAHPEDFWELLTTEAVERLQGEFALVLLRDEEDELVAYPGPDVDVEDLEVLDESPTFIAALEAIETDAAVFREDGAGDEASAEPLFSVAVPIRIDGDVAGAFAVERDGPSAFESGDAEALLALVAVFAPELARFFE